MDIFSFNIHVSINGTVVLSPSHKTEKDLALDSTNSASSAIAKLSVSSHKTTQFCSSFLPSIHVIFVPKIPYLCVIVTNKVE